MNGTLYLDRPKELFQAFLRKLLGDDRRLLVCALVSSMGAAVLAYHYLIIFGAGNPDALAEGLLMYSGYDWACFASCCA